ncbi:MAG: hypothetical protein LBE84_03580 [Planctomycetota bacterium]|jgi:methionyl-tRNA formyltransferase|nr:hypothetical protein [Planctomycetota bacterium]
MRILLLSKADLFGNCILNRLVPALRRDNELAICLSDRIFRNERGFSDIDRYMYYTRDLLLDRLFPALDGDPRWKPGGKLLSFAALGEKHGIPMTPLGGNIELARQATREIAAEFRPEVVFCCRHDFIVPPDVFEPVMFGAYNLHSGAVPHYRGPFCSFWSMMNHDELVGCSLHTLKEKVDTGDVVDTAWVKADYSSPLVSNLLNIYSAGVGMFLGHWKRIRRGPLPGMPQTPDSGTYFPQPDAADCGKFARRGGCLANAERCGEILEQYLPPGVRLEEAIPDWKWKEA